MVVGGVVIDEKYVACSGSRFGSICIAEGMEEKFIDDDSSDVLLVH